MNSWPGVIQQKKFINNHSASNSLFNDQLRIQNSLTREKEIFNSITPGHVGMYVCGPTVSGETHLGHARPYVTFDVVFRYLNFLGYKVRYVRTLQMPAILKRKTVKQLTRFR